MNNDFAGVKYGSMPDLILLDLHLPKVGGFDVLREIRRIETLLRIPVVVLTTSESPIDRKTAGDLGASRYVVKPISPHGLQEILDNLNEGKANLEKESCILVDAD